MDENRYADLPPELATKVSAHTGFPWWNGHAYAEFRGYPARLRLMNNGVGEAIDDINDVIEWLRDEGQYDKSDRLRTIAGRMARLRDDYILDEARAESKDLNRNIARGWK